MLVTKEIDYAIRILRKLSDGQIHSIPDMSESEFIPKYFAYKIIKKLQKKNIISILRGTNGGCKLAADLGKVSLYDIFLTIEMGENRVITACVNPNNRCQWKDMNNDNCTVHQHLCSLQNHVDTQMKNYFILDLLKPVTVN